MRLVNCTELHLPAVLEIFNEAIANSTALWDYEPRTMQMMHAWLASKRAGNLPVTCALDESGAVMGFATYGSFRDRPAYKYTVEHSVYVAVPFRGRGVGHALLREMIATATAQEYHTLIGGIASGNTASIALHRSLGFTHAGTIRDAGFKFGGWLDLEFWQLLLPVPRNPVDG